jgi:hypothetical protein
MDNTESIRPGFPLRDVLHANGPAPDRAPQMMLYGQFVGSWQGALHYSDRNGERHTTTAEVHFGWVLEGRAVQDVWIAPARSGRPLGEPLLMHGTTLRVYDTRSDDWQITWIDPVKQGFDTMRGKKVGADIVQEAVGKDGAMVQWIFTDIVADSFHWLARESRDAGANWRVSGEFFLRRV